ncbi:MAG TPA: zeta toxin family protein [Puia sp.]|nr:zeta toxin family protein [Puia sp.]
MPVLYVIAGPNGIGKTTSSYDLVPANTPIINSDEIAKEVRNAGLSNVNTQEYSNREAIRLMEEERKQRNSFAIETNLADIDTWKFLLEVQKTGYKIHILFMSTDNVKMLNHRIRERTLMGDHFVSPEIVEERYITSLKLLSHYFKRADKLQLFDNSEKTQLLIETSQDRILQLVDVLPKWVTENLGKHLENNSRKERPITDMSIDEVRKMYQEFRNSK